MSESDNCHCEGTTKVKSKESQKRITEKPWSVLRKQTQRV